MNSFETEYSFLAPTWKLPAVATTSMYSRTYGTSYSADSPVLGPDWSLWNNTMYNSRYSPSYVPSTTVRRNYPLSTNHQQMISPPEQQQNYHTPGGRPVQSGPPIYQQTNNPYNNNNYSNDDRNVPMNPYPHNDYQPYNNMPTYGQPQRQPINRGMTYAANGQNNPPPPPPSQRRRVQIIDHNRHTPSTMGNDYASSRQSHHSNSRNNNHTSDLKKSKSSASNQHHDHVDENRFGYTGNNSNNHDYLYGHPEAPGSYTDAFKQQQRRLQDEKLGRKSVISEYKHFAQNGGFGPGFGTLDHQKHEDKMDSEKKKKTYAKGVRETNQYKIENQKRTGEQRKNLPPPIPKYQRLGTTRSQFLSIQEAREYAEKIEKPHHLKPVSQTEFSSSLSPILITTLSNNQRRTSFESVQSLNFNDAAFNQSRRSSSLTSIRPKRRVRFRSRDFIRRRSSTVLDLPSAIIGKSICHRSDSLSISNDEQQKTNFEHLQNPPNILFPIISNENEKKIITSHSMTMRFPPTVTVIINQTYKPSHTTTTSSTNNHPKKSTLKNDFLPSPRPLIVRSIPGPFRNSTINSELDLDFKIKSFHQTDNAKNSSNE